MNLQNSLKMIAMHFNIFFSCSHLRENTIASLKNAHKHGADMVEFDVQLSKDKIPVIYHDFELATTSLGKNGENKELIPTQFNSLTLAQLRGLKVFRKFIFYNVSFKVFMNFRSFIIISKSQMASKNLPK